MGEEWTGQQARGATSGEGEACHEQEEAATQDDADVGRRDEAKSTRYKYSVE